MRTKFLIAALGGMAAIAVAQSSGRAELRTQSGCIVHDFDGGSNSWDSEASGATYDWNGTCESGLPISGAGALLARRIVPDENDTDGTPFLEFEETFAGELVSGYWDGAVSFTVRGRNIGADGQPAGDWKPAMKAGDDGKPTEVHINYTYNMGCIVDKRRPPPDNLANGCVPGVVESADVAAGKPSPAAEEQAAGGEPGGPDHVTEINEAGRETDRFIAAAHSNPPPNYFTLTTDKDCIFFDWMLPDNVMWDRTTEVWTWSEPCEKGQPISGKGTLIWEVPSRKHDPLWYGGVESGELVAGYRNGMWSFAQKIWNKPDEDYGAKPYRMGCIVVDYGPDAGKIADPSCTPASGSQVEVASAPTAREEPAADASTGESTGAKADDEAAGGEPGGPDHVTEISEGGRETDRFIASRVSPDRAPKSNKAHDRSNCLGKYLEEHSAPHNHYVLYNRCEEPINVVWCVMGTGNSCEVGSGSIANMNPRVGYIAGMEDSPGMLSGACSGKVWAVVDGGKTTGYRCE